MLSATSIYQDLQLIRQQSPLIHNITNYVAMNSSANALLALGASPIMAHAIDELDELLNAAKALVINIGTLDMLWLQSMREAMSKAAQKSLPIIIDPVGAGASKFRTQVIITLLEIANPTVIRGNASEILAIAGEVDQTKGVETLHNSDDAVDAAQSLAANHQCIVVVSGETDYCCDGQQIIKIHNGSAMMPKVTGIGCVATSLVGAFVAVNTNTLQATAHAMAVIGICGELASQSSDGAIIGPGSFAPRLLDMLYVLDQSLIETTLRISCEKTAA